MSSRTSDLYKKRMDAKHLPSRVDAKDWSDRYAEVVNDRSMVRIVAAYASGRLVDRKAIDPLLDAARVLVDAQTIEGFGIFEPLRHGLSVVVAAIGDTG